MDFLAVGDKSGCSCCVAPSHTTALFQYCVSEEGEGSLLLGSVLGEAAWGGGAGALGI